MLCLSCPLIWEPKWNIVILFISWQWLHVHGKRGPTGHFHLRLQMWNKQDKDGSSIQTLSWWMLGCPIGSSSNDQEGEVTADVLPIYCLFQKCLFPKFYELPMVSLFFIQQESASVVCSKQTCQTYYPWLQKWVFDDYDTHQKSQCYPSRFLIMFIYKWHVTRII